jgi:hypothetical protein
MDWVEEVREKPERSERSVRMFRLRRNAAGLSRGDLLYVVPGAIPEGGEFVIDDEFRLGRHGGGPVWGVVVGMVRTKAPIAPVRTRRRPQPSGAPTPRSPLLR